jgi:ABC-type phosphate/phosphonate transport system substrate-binding protein
VSDLCFALPPSLGAQNVKALAREFAAVLYEAGFSTVVPISSYENLERSLLSGEIHAAWGPPMVCARVQDAGGKVALRAVRYGCSVYRSALLCRSHDDLKLEEVGSYGLRRLRAVWVDPHSMGGYIMPRHHLRSKGIDLEMAFEQETVLGSYEACFEAVMSCEADITASYANARGVGYVEICREEAYHLRVFAYSDECSNDGVVISPASTVSGEVADRLARLVANPAHRHVFCAALSVDDVEVPPDNAYRPLLALQR